MLFPRNANNITWKNVCVSVGIHVRDNTRVCSGDWQPRNRETQCALAAAFHTAFIIVFLTKKGSWFEFVAFFFSFRDFFLRSECNSGSSVTNISNPRIIAHTCSRKTHTILCLPPITATCTVLTLLGYPHPCFLFCVCLFF